MTCSVPALSITLDSAILHAHLGHRDDHRIAVMAATLIGGYRKVIYTRHPATGRPVFVGLSEPRHRAVMIRDPVTDALVFAEWSTPVHRPVMDRDPVTRRWVLLGWHTPDNIPVTAFDPVSGTNVVVSWARHPPYSGRWNDPMPESIL